MKKPWAGLARLRPGSVARAEDPLTACVRECAQHVASQPGTPGRAQARLAAAIGALVAEHTAHEPSGELSFEALVRVGRAAMEASETRLARRVGDTAVSLRPRSKAAWRLRGQALEAQGREVEAIDAYERHLALATGDSPEVTQRLNVLRERRRCLTEAARIAPDAGLTEQPPEQARTTLATVVAQRLSEHGAGDPDTVRLAEAYGTYCRLGASGRMADPLLGGGRPLGVAGLRAQLAGRSVCVVANGEDVAASGLGAEIDAYDIVVRLDSFQTHPAGTGTRTDVHAVSCRNSGPGWRRPAHTRLVFGDSVPLWRQAVRTRLVPGAQSFVGDRSLSRPLRDPSLLGETGWAAEASTGFTVARLLDFLDVSPRIDLVGFGQPRQLRAAERQWVTAHARRTEQLRIALR